MNRRNFISLAAATAASAALPTPHPMTKAEALQKAQSRWGKYAAVSSIHGAAARAANRPGGEYRIGWKGCPGSSTYYGDSWEDAFSTYELLKDIKDPATGQLLNPEPK